MDWLLGDLRVLVLDAQASGATPAHGDLLELAWASTAADGVARDLESHYVVPRTERRISAAVREITGFSEARLTASSPEQAVYEALCRAVKTFESAGPRVPTAIHVARFELPFLRDLSLRLAGAELPLEVICVHAVATRLFPDLPRRNIRALSGFLGHAVGLVRSASEHVEATAFIWGALLRELDAQGVRTWSELTDFVAQKKPSAPRGRRSFPLAMEQRKSLPDRPGVYRFVRKNGDVLYVGKATSLKKRIAGHFRPTGPRTERTLELLSQVSDVRFTETSSTLEAALLETDEIKALDPPYNVQLRMHERSAWFASERLDDASTEPSDTHRIGPLPSRGAVLAMYAIGELVAGAEATPRLQAMALAVPAAFLPPVELFAQGFLDFAAELITLGGQAPRWRVRRAALALYRRGDEPEESAEDLPPEGWDLARVRRRLTRNLAQAGLYVRRARALCLLVDADVAFREVSARRARLLVLHAGEPVARHDLERVADVSALPTRPVRSLRARRESFDAAHYDRLRVLFTELMRVRSEGGEVSVRVGRHLLGAEHWPLR